jgi:uroporphyrinogen decarboxylase
MINITSPVIQLSLQALAAGTLPTETRIYFMNNNIYFQDFLKTQANEIPVRINFSPTYKDARGIDTLAKIVTDNRDIFPGYERIIENAKSNSYLPWQTAEKDYVDSWGVTWRTSINGMTGAVKKPSIEKWEDLDGFIPPNPELHNGWGKIDWVKKQIGFSENKGIKMGELRHGFLFLTLTYIRGYENLTYDMYDEEPRLNELIDIVYQFNKYHVDKYLALGADILSFPEDLGAQNGPLISPDKFRQYIKPVYEKLIKPVKEKNKLVYMHSDGLVLDLLDDLIETGLDIINLQDLVNGIDNIKTFVKGRLGIDLDIDRQSITVYGSEKDIDDHIKEAVVKLGDNEKGFGMFYEIYPETPVNNINAVINAFRKYKNYYA